MERTRLFADIDRKRKSAHNSSRQFVSTPAGMPVWIEVQLDAWTRLRRGRTDQVTEPSWATTLECFPEWTEFPKIHLLEYPETVGWVNRRRANQRHSDWLSNPQDRKVAYFATDAGKLAKLTDPYPV